MDLQREVDRQVLLANLLVLANVPWDALMDMWVNQMRQQQEDQEQPQDHAEVGPQVEGSSFVPEGSGPPPTEGPVIVEGHVHEASFVPSGSGPPPTEDPVVVVTEHVHEFTFTEAEQAAMRQQQEAWSASQNLQAKFLRGQFLQAYLLHWRLEAQSSNSSSNSNSGNNCAAEDVQRV